MAKIKQNYRLSVESLEQAGDSIKMIKNYESEKEIKQVIKDPSFLDKSESSSLNAPSLDDEKIELDHIEKTKIHGLKTSLENCLKYQTNGIADIEDFGMSPLKVQQLLKSYKVNNLSEIKKKFEDQIKPIECGLVKIHELKSKPQKSPRLNINSQKIEVKVEIHPELEKYPEPGPSNYENNSIKKIVKPCQKLLENLDRIEVFESPYVASEKPLEVKKEEVKRKKLSQSKLTTFFGLFKFCCGKK